MNNNATICNKRYVSITHSLKHISITYRKIEKYIIYLSDTANMNTYPSTPELTIRMDYATTTGSVRLDSWRRCNRKAPNSPILKKKRRRRSSVSMQPLSLNFDNM